MTSVGDIRHISRKSLAVLMKTTKNANRPRNMTTVSAQSTPAGAVGEVTPTGNRH